MGQREGARAGEGEGDQRELSIGRADRETKWPRKEADNFSSHSTAAVCQSCTAVSHDQRGVVSLAVYYKGVRYSRWIEINIPPTSSFCPCQLTEKFPLQILQCHIVGVRILICHYPHGNESTTEQVKRT